MGGAVLGRTAPGAGQWLGEQVDYTLLTLVGFLFFNVRLYALLHVRHHWYVLLAALMANFLCVPLIGYGVASLFLSTHPMIMVGVVIYFMSPCTDWFLGFTRLSGGNVELGMALIPINMILQLLLYPLYLKVFVQHTVAVDAGTLGSTLFLWFLVPLAVALIVHKLLCMWLGDACFTALLARLDRAVPWVIGLLVMEIFAANIDVILSNRDVFALVLAAVFIFFVLTFLLSEGLSRLLRLRYPEYALLTMTTAARNAPLMLAVTMAALPRQPLIYAGIVIGMLIEFPHLTALRRVLLGVRRRSQL